MVLVTTAGWDDRDATLACFERTSSNALWREVRTRFPVTIGKNGLGWGLGLHPTNGLAGPVKREGDGKAPAGRFRLSGAFGYAEPDQMRWIRLPYVCCTKSLECVDDVSSSRYNLTLDRKQVERPDWQSSEQMRRTDDLYRLGVFVDHNTAPPVPGRGSCIFLHIWRGPGTGTSGCTAMPEERLEELLRWLDPAKNPVLVQLPIPDYARWREAWQLPAGAR